MTLVQYQDPKNRMEIMWGTRILDDGFTSIPNLLIRNYRHVGLQHGEFCFVLTVLTYKHDVEDPYPSRETIAKHMNVGVRQIDKYIEALKEKELILIGHRRAKDSKFLTTSVYNFKPLIDAVCQLVGEAPLPASTNDYDIEWETSYRPKVRGAAVDAVTRYKDEVAVTSTRPEHGDRVGTDHRVQYGTDLQVQYGTDPDVQHGDDLGGQYVPDPEGQGAVDPWVQHPPVPEDQEGDELRVQPKMNIQNTSEYDQLKNQHNPTPTKSHIRGELSTKVQEWLIEKKDVYKWTSAHVKSVMNVFDELAERGYFDDDAFIKALESTEHLRNDSMYDFEECLYRQAVSFQALARMGLGR